MIGCIKSFLKDTSGNFGMIFALSTIPLFGFAGLALDYTNAARVKTQMQSAVDAAALSAIIEFHQNGNKDQNALAKAYFDANYSGEVAVATSATLSAGKNEIAITADTDVPTTLSALLGKTKFDVTVTSKASIKTSDLQIAFALDNTGSMKHEGKMSLLKKSAKDFVDKILPLGSTTDNLVQFSMVPFTTVVRVNANLADSWWLDLNGIAEADFEGCIWDRAGSLSTTDSDPIIGQTNTFYQASPASLYETKGCAAQTVITPLTQSRTTIKSAISDLKADGNTNTAIGMAWAQNTLNNTLPFKNNANNTKKIIIFLTDGENTNSRSISEGGTAADVDAATLAVCSAAKAKGVQIYAIRVKNGNAAMIQSCASEPSNYFDLKSATKLDDVFKEISDQIWQSMIALKQ